MEEQLISIEIAKLAKEKGFNLPVNRCYTEIVRNLVKTRVYHDFNEKGGLYYSAPTQSLLQKWLWEIHKIWVDVSPFYLFKGFGVEVYQPTKENPSGYLPIEGLKGETPQEVLELGLQEALKLIKELKK